MRMGWRAVALLTDFGEKDGFVAVMEAHLRLRWNVPVVLHVSHHVAPQDILEGAFLLQMQFSYFPAGTLFVVVIDPGVGTERSILFAVDSSGQYGFLAPDNGILDLVQDRTSLIFYEVHWQNIPELSSHRISRTFHGRDIFVPVAGTLFHEFCSPEQWNALPYLERQDRPVRRLPESLVLLSRDVQERQVVESQILYFDRFGNAITGILSLGDAEPSVEYLEIHHPDRIQKIYPARAYASVQPGEAGILWNAEGFLEIFVREGSAKEHLQLERKTPVRVWLA